MSKKTLKKSNKYFDLQTKEKNNNYFTYLNSKNLSLDNPNDFYEIELHSYDEYIRDLRSKTIDRGKVDLQHVENIFINDIYYKAMKQLPLIERKILFLSFVENERDVAISLIIRKSPNEILKLRDISIKHFKANVEFYKKGDKCNG